MSARKLNKSKLIQNVSISQAGLVDIIGIFISREKSLRSMKANAVSYARDIDVNANNAMQIK